MFDFSTNIGAGGVAKGNILVNVTKVGGTSNLGTLFTFNEQTGVLTNLVNFAAAPDGNDPQAAPILASDGKWYGTTRLGGATNVGSIYEYDFNGSGYLKLVDLVNPTTGHFPQGGLIQATNGKLYGVCRFSGPGGGTTAGTLFSYEIGVGLTVVYTFVAANGSGINPFMTPIQGTNGKLYGTTLSGTVANSGTIYQYDIDLAQFTVLRTFTTGVGGGGAQPVGGIMEASNGLFYGTTNQGGTNNIGVIYSFNVSTLAYTVLHNAVSATGGQFQSRLVEYDGILYGTSTTGGANNVGTLFSYNIGSNTYTKLYDFAAATGSRPLGNVVKIGNALYFGSSTGTVANSGSIIRYDLGSNTATTIYGWPAAAGVQTGQFLTFKS